MDFLEELPAIDTEEMEDLYRHFLIDDMPEVKARLLIKAAVMGLGDKPRDTTGSQCSAQLYTVPAMLCAVRLLHYPYQSSSSMVLFRQLVRDLVFCDPYYKVLLTYSSTLPRGSVA